MRAHDTDPWWLTEGLDLVGFESEDDSGEDDEGEDEENDDTDEEEENSDDEGADDEDEESEEDDKEGGKKNIAGLKKALREERLARKKAERELRKLKPPKKTPPPPKDDDEDKDGESNSDSNKDDARVIALASKLKKSAIDTAILSFGDGFKSSEELLALVNRSEIDVDQDEEDPSEIDVDLETVEAAVKALAKKSPHLMKGRGTGSKSGSKFGGKNSRNSKASDEQLKKKYSALRK